MKKHPVHAATSAEQLSKINLSKVKSPKNKTEKKTKEKKSATEGGRIYRKLTESIIEDSDEESSSSKSEHKSTPM
jgi:hypothetical protein